jgi:uncharacterized secreted repeat protein (TIGR03808 family)
MGLDRRQFFKISALTTTVPAVAIATPSAAAPMSMLGIDAVQLGVRAGGTIDQTVALQNAIDQTAGARVPLVLGPGEYRAGELKLPTGTQIVGVRGATRLTFEGGAGLITARGADHVTLSGLTLDGKGKPMPKDRGLLQLSSGGDIRIIDCEIVNSGRNGIVLEEIEGAVSGTTVTSAIDTAIVSRDARGLSIANNTVRDAGNGGILVMRAVKGDDGTLVLDNRIENIAAARESVGQSGTAIFVSNADNVTVRSNRIHHAAFCGVRGKAASNLQIISNIVNDVGDIALYSEFGFEGVVIANNTVNGAALGVAVVNFNEGGRLAVVQGNIIRNLKSKRPAGIELNDGASAGVGITVEADAAITGNVIENAPDTGIKLGWGQFLRDVTVTGNVVRSVGYGVTASVSSGAGQAVIAANMIAEAAHGAIVGMDYTEVLPDELSKNTTRFAQLTVRGNKVR